MTNTGRKIPSNNFSALHDAGLETTRIIFLALLVLSSLVGLIFGSFVPGDWGSYITAITVALFVDYIILCIVDVVVKDAQMIEEDAIGEDGDICRCGADCNCEDVIGSSYRTPDIQYVVVPQIGIGWEICPAKYVDDILVIQDDVSYARKLDVAIEIAQMLTDKL